MEEVLGLPPQIADSGICAGDVQVRGTGEKVPGRLQPEAGLDGAELRRWFVEHGG